MMRFKIIEKIDKSWKSLTKPIPLDYFDNYDDYWNKRGFYTPLNRAKLLSQYIEPNSSILDIGCGDGTLIDYIFKKNKPREIVGIDVSKKAVEYVKMRGYEAYKIDINKNAFGKFMKNRRFDYIIITEVLEHIQNPEKVIMDIKDSYYKSIFVSIPNAGHIMCRLRLLFGRFPIVVILHHVKEHIRFWTHKDFVYWCDYLGFKIVNYVPSSTSKIFNVDLGEMFPSLFAGQIVYEIKKKSAKG